MEIDKEAGVTTMLIAFYCFFNKLIIQHPCINAEDVKEVAIVKDSLRGQSKDIHTITTSTLYH